MRPSFTLRSKIAMSGVMSLSTIVPVAETTPGERLFKPIRDTVKVSSPSSSVSSATLTFTKRLVSPQLKVTEELSAPKSEGELAEPAKV